MCRKTFDWGVELTNSMTGYQTSLNYRQRLSITDEQLTQNKYLPERYRTTDGFSKIRGGMPSHPLFATPLNRGVRIQNF